MLFFTLQAVSSGDAKKQAGSSSSGDQAGLSSASEEQAGCSRAVQTSKKRPAKKRKVSVQRKQHSEIRVYVVPPKQQQLTDVDSGKLYSSLSLWL